MDSIFGALNQFLEDVHAIRLALKRIADYVCAKEVTGLGITFGSPEDRPQPKETSQMAKVSLKKHPKGAAKPQAKPHPQGAPNPTDFNILDTQDDAFTIQGVDSAGNPVDISGVATIAVTSSDVTIFTVDPPTGMTDKLHAVKIGSANLTVVATWNDGSHGPFTITVKIDVATGGPTGLSINFGTPVIR